MRKLLRAVPLAAVLLLPAAAGAQPARPLATLTVRGLFGDDLPMNDAFVPILVEVENHTRRTFRGRVVLSARHWQSPPQRHQVQLDLPPRQTRRVVLDAFLTDATTVEASYVVDDDRLAHAVLSPSYAPSQQAVVVLSDPPRLRPALLDLEVEQHLPPDPWGGGGGTSVVRTPIGQVPLDPATGDPILPTDAVAWSTVSVLVAGAPDLARVGPAEQLALTDWIRAGGQLLVFPRSDADLSEPFLRSLAGDLAWLDGAYADRPELVPEAVRGKGFTSQSPGFRAEPYGASRRLGFGRVHVATWDGAAPPYVEAPETRLLVQSIASVRRTRGVGTPLLPFGRRKDDAMAGTWFGGTPGFATLRSALDPNEGYRPALGLVAVVLLLYVLVVGPVNFAFVGKRNRPTLALATTPVAACCCLAVMLGVGYLGKGTRMRYRAVEVVELQEGDDAGPARRYSGLFLTRPATFDLESPERGMTSLVRLPSADLGPTVDHGGDRPVLRGLRGRLWETVFVREDRIADLGGAVTFERSGQRLVAVHNGSSVTLRGAVVVDGVGSVYRVGTIPPGGRAAVAQVAEMTIAQGTVFYGEDDPSLRQLAGILGLPEEHHRALDGATKVLGGSLVTPPVPALVAWAADVSAARAEVADTFGREVDLQLVRVVPAVERERVDPVYLTPTDPYGETTPAPFQQEAFE